MVISNLLILAQFCGLDLSRSLILDTDWLHFKKMAGGEGKLEEKQKKWDLKQLGAGGGSVIALLFLFQNRGIDLMQDHQAARNDVVIEKTLSNASRIDRLENMVTDMDNKLDDGFKDLRIQIKGEIESLRSLIHLSSGDRVTRTEHRDYKESLDERINALKAQIEYLNRQIPGSK